MGEAREGMTSCEAEAPPMHRPATVVAMQKETAFKAKIPWLFHSPSIKEV